MNQSRVGKQQNTQRTDVQSLRQALSDGNGRDNENIVCAFCKSKKKKKRINPFLKAKGRCEQNNSATEERNKVIPDVTRQTVRRSPTQLNSRPSKRERMRAREGEGGKGGKGATQETRSGNDAFRKMLTLSCAGSAVFSVPYTCILN